METTQTVRLRPKHQITLPMQIVEQAGLAPDALLLAKYSHGVITLTPQASARPAGGILAYAGVAKHCWGQSAAEVQQHIDELREDRL